MKKLLKLSFTALLSINLFACNIFALEPELTAVGNWENTIKNTDGASVVTSVLITETKLKDKNISANIKGFSAKIDSKVDGTESDTLKLVTKSINVSGTMDSGNLTITDVDSDTDSISTSSRFYLSKDGKYLTLQPGDIKFRRKESK